MIVFPVVAGDFLSFLKHPHRFWALNNSFAVYTVVLSKVHKNFTLQNEVQEILNTDT